jgi:FkbM family methyltransferase
MPRSSTRRGLSTFEIIALVAVTVAVTFVAATTLRDRQMARHYYFAAPALEEFEPFIAKYAGQPRHARNIEDWIIRDHFQDKREGIFLDVGSNHYRDESNTYYLETGLGWSGIAVDAIEEFRADYEAHRPRTRFVAMFASDAADSSVQFFVADNHLVSSSNPEFVQKHKAQSTARTVPTTTLNVLLDQAGVTKLDLLSMDIELAEPKALAGFDIDRFRPELVCIEGHSAVRQQILDYFTRHGYVLLGKYLRMDPANLYFAPLTAAR